jgi:hypothetical protein
VLLILFLYCRIGGCRLGCRYIWQMVCGNRIPLVCSSMWRGGQWLVIADVAVTKLGVGLLGVEGRKEEGGITMSFNSTRT